MKGCEHDRTLMEDECDCPRPVMHTNGVEAGMPHESLTEYIVAMEHRLNLIYVAADDLRVMLGQAQHNYHRNQFRTGDCKLCAARTKADEIRGLSNLTARRDDPAPS